MFVWFVLFLFCVVVLLPPSVYCRSMFAGHTKAVRLLVVVLVERDTRFPMSNLIHSRFFVAWTASIPRDPSQPASKKKRQQYRPRADTGQPQVGQGNHSVQELYQLLP